MDDFHAYCRRLEEIIQNPKKAKLSYRGHSFILDYWVLPYFGAKIRPEPIINIPGSTSGAEDASELPLFLAMMGFEVIIYSPPGEGNSSEAPKWFYDTPTFRHEANIALELLRHIGAEKAIFLGHSNGACTAAAAAVHSACHGIEATAFAALNPADLKRIPTVTGLYLRQMLKFAVSGTLTRLISGKKEAAFQKLRDFFPPFKKPFRWSHLGKMVKEMKKSSRGSLPGILQFLKCPLVVIFSRHDFVFPLNSRFGSSRMEVMRQSVDAENIFVSEIPGLHNVTMGGKTVRRTGWELIWLLRDAL